MSKNCINCGKPFEPEPNNPEQDACSIKCTRAYVKRMSAQRRTQRTERLIKAFKEVS